MSQPLQVALRRDQHAGRAGDGLDDHRGDGARVVQRHDPLELVGEVCAMIGFAARVCVARQVVRVRQVVDAGQLRREELAVVDHAADRNAAEADAVVPALAADQPRARAFAADAVVGECDLQRRVDRLRARVREEHVVEPRREPAHDVVRQLERQRVAHLEHRREIHLGDLAADGLGNLATSVAGVHAPQSRRPVEHLPALGRPVVHALGFREQAGLGLELPVRRERHPEGFELGAVERVLGGHGQSLGGWPVGCPMIRKIDTALK